MIYFFIGVESALSEWMKNISPDPYKGLKEENWWWPERLPADSELESNQDLLSKDQRKRFLNDGFIVVDDLWPSGLIDQATAETRELFPEEKVAARSLADERYRPFSSMPWIHRGEQSADLAINHMSIHPRAVKAASELLQIDVTELRLYQDHLIAKFGRAAEPDGADSIAAILGDQDIHVDYGNNTLLVPPRGAGPEAVACLCYYSDVEDAGGATHFARAQPGELTKYSASTFNPPNFVFGTENGSAVSSKGLRSGKRTDQRYREEKPIRYRQGTCVLYRLDAWHRGTPAGLNKVRYSHHRGWRKRQADWISWQGLAPRMSLLPNRYLEDLTVEQRAVLGFPSPGEPYWTEETVDSVGQRYTGMDMRPYEKEIQPKT